MSTRGHRDAPNASPLDGRERERLGENSVWRSAWVGGHVPVSAKSSVVRPENGGQRDLAAHPRRGLLTATRRRDRVETPTHTACHAERSEVQAAKQPGLSSRAAGARAHPAGSFAGAQDDRKNAYSHRLSRTQARAGRKRAFTLVEILVVIGVIMLLVAGVAVALSGRSGEGAALANSQNIVSGLLASARAQAVLRQTNARVLVYAQRPPSGEARKYLRSLQVVVEEPALSGRYVAVDDPVTLPEPVCVVPSGSVPPDHLNTGVVWLRNPSPVSTMNAQNSFSYFGRVGGQRQFFGVANASGRVFYIQFGSDGMVNQPSTNAKIAVATAVLSANAVPKFNNPRGVRGAFLRRSGAISLVDDATGF